jgi:hypothetical protein
MTRERAGRLAWAARLAWSLWALAVGLAAVGLIFLAVNGSTVHANSIGSPTFDALFGIVYLLFSTVGALIASRHPRNPIGWLFLLAGVGAELEDALLGWATYALLEAPAALPGGALAGLLADLVWLPTLVVSTTLLFLLFPDGRLPSPRWRPLAWLAVALGLVFPFGTALVPGDLYFFPGVTNPLAVEALEPLTRRLVDVADLVILPTAIASMLALVLRFRRSSGIERQQLKWLVYSAAVFGAVVPFLVILSELGVRLAGIPVSDVLFAVCLAALPVAVGMAILRRRLYDIDVVVKRTLVYGALTATLVGAYLGSVLLLGLALSPLTEDSKLAVAASTLAVAALFRPARTRIQAAVDRRFYRRSYDAARTLEAFSGRLRDQLDLEALGADLRAVVSETMQPAHVSLWLRSHR